MNLVYEFVLYFWTSIMLYKLKSRIGTSIKMLNKMSPNVNDTLFVFYGILIPVIAVFGFVGNGLVLYILIR